MEKFSMRIENGLEDNLRFLHQGIEPRFSAKQSATLI